MAQVQTGVGVKNTGDVYTASEFNSVNSAINQNSADSQSKLVNQRAINTLADISDLLVSGTYELPEGTYYFNNPIDFVTADILFTDVNGCYDLRTNCIATITYTGTTPFITSGATGQVVTFSPFRVICTSALVFDGDGFAGDSFISDFGIFISCKEMVRLTSWNFFTVGAFAGIDCEAGVTLNNVANVNLFQGQWNLSQGNGSAFITLLGASSGRLIGGLPNSQPATNDFYFDVQSNYSGSISLVGGDHTTGGGEFFKTTGGSRDQDDPDILVLGVNNVPNSQAKAAGYIAEGAQATTTIVTQDVPVVVAGTWTASVETKFTFDAAGKATYLGKADFIFPIMAKLQVTPASGTNREYDLHIRKNGTIIDLASRDHVRVDSGNPGKAVLITSIPMSTNDFIELVIEGTNSTTNVDCTAATLTI